MTDGFILNKPPKRKRDVVIERSGRITLRSRPCRTLSLKVGDRVVFYMSASQMYVYKDNAAPLGLRLSGRPSQLHVCSAETARNIIRHTDGAAGLAHVELQASAVLSSLTVDGVRHDAIAIINIVSKY